MTKELYGMYLGIALSEFAKLSISDWQFYAILVPTVVLVTISNNK